MDAKIYITSLIDSLQESFLRKEKESEAKNLSEDDYGHSLKTQKKLKKYQFLLKYADKLELTPGKCFLIKGTDEVIEPIAMNLLNQKSHNRVKTTLAELRKMLK